MVTACGNFYLPTPLDLIILYIDQVDQQKGCIAILSRSDSIRRRIYKKAESDISEREKSKTYPHQNKQ